MLAFPASPGPAVDSSTSSPLVITTAEKRTPTTYLSAADMDDAATPANDPHYPARRVPTEHEPASTLYEEYHPHGTSSYAANDSGIEVSAKRYRYIGKERDDETGLYHLGARYYASWLARWTAADPSGLADTVNRYAYAGNRPIGSLDVTGRAEQKTIYQPMLVTTGRGSGGRGPQVYEDDPDFIGTRANTEQREKQGGDLLAIEGGGAPKKPFASYQRKQAKYKRELAKQAHERAEKSRKVGAGIQIVGGVAEIVTGVFSSPLGGGALIVLGADQLTAGIATLATGRAQETLVHHGAREGLQAAGVDPATANTAASFVEAGVHVGTGIASSPKSPVTASDPFAPAIAAEAKGVTVYRVEGTPNTRILIGEAGEVAITGDQTLFLNFGSRARAEEFLQKRLGQGMPGAEVKSFEVPQSFLDDIRAAAVPESKARSFPDRPIIADPTKAPDQFGLRPEQLDALRAAVTPGSGKRGL